MSATSIKAIPSTILENPTWISVHELAATVDSQAVSEDAAGYEGFCFKVSALRGHSVDMDTPSHIDCC